MLHPCCRSCAECIECGNVLPYQEDVEEGQTLVEGGTFFPERIPILFESDFGF